MIESTYSQTTLNQSINDVSWRGLDTEKQHLHDLIYRYHIADLHFRAVIENLLLHDMTMSTGHNKKPVHTYNWINELPVTSSISHFWTGLIKSELLALQTQYLYAYEALLKYQEYLADTLKIPREHIQTMIMTFNSS